MNEAGFIAAIRALASHEAARDLRDDAAVLDVGGTRLVLTHDMIAQGVHFLASDPPGDVAWKLLAVNLSDLAAKGARPLGVLLGYTLGEDAWDQAFVAGLGEALAAFSVPLLGGDTVSAHSGRSFGLTAVGEATGTVPSRSGARAGDGVWVTGTIGDAGLGLRVAQGEYAASPLLLERYRRPTPRLAAGRRLATLASAMMDVSDGLLIDASRITAASGAAITLDLGSVPLSPALVEAAGSDRKARLEAATAGDDYELLFTAPASCSGDIETFSQSLGLAITRIGMVEDGAGLRLFDRGGEIALPPRLGYEHNVAGKSPS